MQNDCTFGASSEHNHLTNHLNRDSETKQPYKSLKGAVQMHPHQNSPNQLIESLANQYHLRGNLDYIERLNQHLTQFPLQCHPDELSSNMDTACKAFMINYDHYFDGDSFTKPLVRTRWISQSLDRRPKTSVELLEPAVRKFELPVHQKEDQAKPHQVTFGWTTPQPGTNTQGIKTAQYESTQATQEARHEGFRTVLSHQRGRESPNAGGSVSLPRHLGTVRKFDPTEATFSGKPRSDWQLNCYPTAVDHPDTVTQSQLQPQANHSRDPPHPYPDTAAPKRTVPLLKPTTDHFQHHSHKSVLSNRVPPASTSLFPNRSLTPHPLETDTTAPPITLSDVGPLLEAEDFLLEVYRRLGEQQVGFGWSEYGRSSNTEHRMLRLYAAFEHILTLVKAVATNARSQ